MRWLVPCFCVAPALKPRFSLARWLAIAERCCGFRCIPRSTDALLSCLSFIELVVCCRGVVGGSITVSEGTLYTLGVFATDCVQCYAYTTAFTQKSARALACPTHVLCCLLFALGLPWLLLARASVPLCVAGGSSSRPPRAVMQPLP